ncbi:aldo/keto reductase [Leptolyngbya sp. GB1-A1]|uniref:aldo/keto reductase n=1 Tax=Leptolyngbya sp. GB1-A1 TaxID=2933908 RepID=UPI0032977053
MTTNSESLPLTYSMSDGLPVNRVGYGAMRLTGQPGNFGAYADWEGGKTLLRRAVELGVNFIDTAEAYGPGFNEELIAAALHPYPKNLVIATKGGIVKTSPSDIRPNGNPENLRRGCEASLQRLKLDRIDLYQLHRPDPNVPFLKSIEMLAELQREGKIRHIGLSNVSIDQIEQARQIIAIAAVQNRFSLTDRSGEETLDYCTQHNIMFIPHGSLGAHPLRQGAPLANATGALADIATQHGVQSSQVALAWMLGRAPNIVLIPGTTAIAHLEENTAATSIKLTVDELELLNRM